MKEWLLKEEPKNKVGRPKLANDKVVKKARVLIVISLVICFILSFGFISVLNNVNPFRYAYSLTFEKLFGSLQNQNGFLIKEGYDSQNNYVMEVKPSSQVNSYSGSYKYVLYKLSQSEWKEVKKEEFDVKTKSFKINIDSLKNKNQTFKIELYVLNAAKIDTSFAPYGWEFSDSSNQNEKHAYKVFTVKGYYSPVSLNEINEAKEKENVIKVSTNKNDPRVFNIAVPGYEYDVIVKYTDETDKEITLKDDKGKTGESSYEIPNVNKTTKVTFMVWAKGINYEDLKKLSLSNWNIKKDKNGKYYVTFTYDLKPERAYQN